MTRGSKACRRPALLVLAGLAAAVALAPANAFAQDDEDGGGGQATAPIVVGIDGPCALTVDGRDTPCRGVAYMVFPSTARIDFTAITETAGYAFSGETDDNEDGQYALQVDSVLGLSADRIRADGECRMTVAADRRTVTGLQCQAATDAGEMTLRASGRVTVADDSEDQDDDD